MFFPSCSAYVRLWLPDIARCPLESGFGGKAEVRISKRLGLSLILCATDCMVPTCRPISSRKN